MNLFSLITPNNIPQEKEKFFSQANYNPQFLYDWDSPLIQQWVVKHPKYKNFVDALLSQDHQKITSEGEFLFDNTLQENIFIVAEEALGKLPPSQDTPPIDVIVETFQRVLRSLDIHYEVKISDLHGFNFRKPSDIENTLLVSRHLNMQFFSLDGEIKHELLHIIRQENTRFNSIPNSKQYLPTEEGLATYFQDYSGKDGTSSLFQHAAEYTVMKVGRSGSFTDMTNYLEKLGFSKELAWQRVLRHKLGFKDTSLPDDNMKSSMYFFHSQKIRDLNDEERLRLLVGKIRLDELEKYPKYKGILPKEKLVEFYKLKIDHP